MPRTTIREFSRLVLDPDTREARTISVINRPPVVPCVAIGTWWGDRLGKRMLFHRGDELDSLDAACQRATESGLRRVEVVAEIDLANPRQKIVLAALPSTSQRPAALGVAKLWADEHRKFTALPIDSEEFAAVQRAIAYARELASGGKARRAS